MIRSDMANSSSLLKSGERAADVTVEDGTLNLADLRRQYAAGTDRWLERLPADPWEEFARWFAIAHETGVTEPNAMVLATASPDGAPLVRTVLMKGFEAGAVYFFSQRVSRKGRHIAANPSVALMFPWHPIERQIAMTGVCAEADPELTERYFAERPRLSQIAARASEQSAPLGSYEELDRRFQRELDRHGETVPRPDRWVGYRVRVTSMEFWRGRANRLHERALYRRTPGGWTVELLNP
jgi:pyridoxamine 5'-phosphate oxidase